MFDTLLASGLPPQPQVRSAVTALVLHLAVGWGVVSATTASRATLPAAARDTIQLDLTRLTMLQHRPLTRTAPPNAEPELPGPPVMSELPLNIPAPALPRFTAPPLHAPALISGSRTAASRRADATSGPGAAVFPESEVDVLPELMSQVQPRYPEALRAAGVKGQVVLEYIIGTGGTVDTASVLVVLSTHPAFTGAAREALRVAHFSPARRAGRPIAVRVRQTIRFVTQYSP